MRDELPGWRPLMGILPPRVICLAMLTALTIAGGADAEEETWPPRAFLVRSLAAAAPRILESQDAETGRFGSEPWICQDQNVIFVLAAAWAVRHEENPWYHDPRVLEAVCKGGEALVDDQDQTGKWIFRKKDNSTWGMIHMPWTYSRWVRAYHLVRDAMPAASRERWEQGLRLGFMGIRAYMDGGVHNIPTHHAMGLYIAGVAFDNEEWREAATRFIAKVVSEQDAAGFWSEHYGPVVGYNQVYVDALGIYYHFSRDLVVLRALERAAQFHASILWPDGSSVAAIDERQVYHAGRNLGNVGFSWTPEGRGFLAMQLGPRVAKDRLVDADYAAAMLLYGGEGEGVPPAAVGERSVFVLGDGDALVRRHRPWQWCLSGYACPPPDNRWIQDRQNLLDVFHDDLGLVIGGGNTKLQPYWSTFTVGDPGLLRHRPGDEAPDFTPEVDLLWVPDEATLDAGRSRLDLRYGDVNCWVQPRPGDDGSLALTYRAEPVADRRVEAHVPILRRAGEISLASGGSVSPGQEDVVLDGEEVGGHIVWDRLRVTVPAGAELRWPARQHNPYAKDGSAPLSSAKLVLVLPFSEEVREYTVVLSRVMP